MFSAGRRLRTGVEIILGAIVGAAFRTTADGLPTSPISELPRAGST